MNTQALVQYIDNGSFFYHSSAYVWNDNDWHTEISILRENGFNGTGFNEYANDVMRRFRSMSVIDYESSLSIPHIDLMFKFRQTTALNKNGFPFITSCGPPLAYKKGAFLKKIGGYVIEQSIEDEIIRLMPFVFDNIVYIKRPCYLQCTMYKNALERDSASVDVIKAGKNNIFDKLIVKNYNRIYQIIGDCRNFVEPIWFE